MVLYFYFNISLKVRFLFEMNVSEQHLHHILTKKWVQVNWKIYFTIICLRLQNKNNKKRENIKKRTSCLRESSVGRVTDRLVIRKSGSLTPGWSTLRVVRWNLTLKSYIKRDTLRAGMRPKMANTISFLRCQIICNKEKKKC